MHVRVAEIAEYATDTLAGYGARVMRIIEHIGILNLIFLPRPKCTIYADSLLLHAFILLVLEKFFLSLFMCFYIEYVYS